MESIRNNLPAVNFNTNDFGTDELQLLQFRDDSLESGLLDYVWVYTTVEEDRLLANLENILREVQEDYPGVGAPKYAYAGEDIYIALPSKAIIKITPAGEQEPGFFGFNVVVSADFSVFSRITTYLKSIKTPRQRVDGVYDLNIKYFNFHPQHGVMHRRFHMETTAFDRTRAELYPYLNMDVLVDLYSESDESILILQGEPGTGKTSMMKLLMREMAVRGKTDLEIAYVKDRDVLSQNSFWIMMTESEPDMLILDDLDEELLPRTQNDDNTIVNQLLSFSDGIFQTDTKVLVTTNLSTSKIDPALVRPGRCFDALRIIPLQISGARDLWGGLYEMDSAQFDISFADDIQRGHISQARLVSEVMRVRALGAAPYLLNQDISVRREYIEQKQ